jgi:Phage integrase, N-terminal SAM-like domain
MAEMSPLRRRMIEDMTVRNLSPATQRSYLHAVEKFSRYFGHSPDRLSLEDVRGFQVHLVSTGTSRPALNQTVRALRFFYGVTLGQAEIPERIPYAREPRKLPVVLNADESRALSRGGAKSEDARGVDDGVCRRPARVRSGKPQGLRYRQRPDGHPGRARQGTQGSLRHAVDAAAGHSARRSGVPLRQSYLRVAKRAAIMVGRYTHAHQFKRARRQLKFLRTRLGRIMLHAKALHGNLYDGATRPENRALSAFFTDDQEEIVVGVSPLRALLRPILEQRMRQLQSVIERSESLRDQSRSFVAAPAALRRRTRLLPAIGRRRRLGVGRSTAAIRFRRWWPFGSAWRRRPAATRKRAR